MTENRMKVAENTPTAQNAPAPACGPADNGIALYHADAKGSQRAEDGREASDNETRMKGSATKENAEAEAPDAEVSDRSLADNDQPAVIGGADEAAGISVEETVKSPLEPDSTASENAGEAKLVIEYTRSDLEERLEAVRTEAEKYQDDQTMSQTSRYAAAEYVRNLWDRELNLIYSSIHKEMDESAAEALRREEVEWIRKRDLAADKASAKSNSTPSQSIEYVRTSASVTMDRCYELLENYGDYLEPEEN